jgi:peptidoglycan/LPS O-acetylase OafA/YrhL
MNRMKPLVAAAVPLLSALGSLIITGTINAPELALGITGFLTAFVVLLLGRLDPNQQAGVRAWTKAIGAAVTPLVSALIQYFFIPGSTTKSQLATVAVGVLTALLMAYVQSEPDS